MADFKNRIPGADIYLVGGAVRDSIMGIVPKDYDFTTNISIEEIENHFDCVNIGQSKSFGIVAILYNGNTYEVARFRDDGDYNDGRHPDSVRFDVSLKDDLSRRDFTINAMAMDIDGNIIDPFNGQQDIKDGVIRAVGNPERRIKEDGLRILRAIRFEATFDFWMDMSLSFQIASNPQLLQNLSEERITGEIIKSASKGGKVFSRFFKRIDGLGFMPIIFPEIEEMKKYKQHWEHHPEGCTMLSKTGEIEPLRIADIQAGTHTVLSCGSVYDHTVSVLDAIPETADEFLVLSALYHDIGKPITAELKDELQGTYGFKMHEHAGVKVFDEIAKKRKIGGLLCDVIKFCIEYHMIANNQIITKKSKILELGLHEFFPIVMEVARADDLSRNVYGNILYDEERFNANMQKFIDAKNNYIDNETFKRKIAEFVNGNKIMELTGLKPSRKVGEILYEVREFIIEKDFQITIDEVNHKIISLK